MFGCRIRLQRNGTGAQITHWRPRASATGGVVSSNPSGARHFGHLAGQSILFYRCPHLGEGMTVVLIVLALVVVGCFVVGILTDRPLDYIPR